MKHPHAELMLQYAQDAMETDKPWERWEFFSRTHNAWLVMYPYNIPWSTNTQYRRKKETIVINGIKVSKPIDKPLRNGQEYYLADPSTSPYYFMKEWDNDHTDKRWLKRGLIHRDKESAIIHAKALLSFTTKDTDE